MGLACPRAAAASPPTRLWAPSREEGRRGGRTVVSIGVGEWGVGGGHGAVWSGLWRVRAVCRRCLWLDWGSWVGLGRLSAAGMAEQGRSVPCFIIGFPLGGGVPCVCNVHPGRGVSLIARMFIGAIVTLPTHAGDFVLGGGETDDRGVWGSCPPDFNCPQELLDSCGLVLVGEVAADAWREDV